MEKKAPPVLNALRTANGVQLVIFCDHCRRWHRHGAVGPEFGRGDGHRTAHCIDKRSPYKHTGYVLREVGPLTRDNRYRIDGRQRVRGLSQQDYVYLHPAQS